MKLFLLFLSGALLISAYADDVKIVSEKDSVCVANGKIKLEIKKDRPLILTDAKGEAVLNISFPGKEKLKAARWNIEKDTSSESVIAVYTAAPEKILAIFSIKKDSEYILVYPGRDTNGTLVEMKSEVSVLPDMLAEDYLYFPDKIKNRCRIPTESYCIMNLMNGGNSVAACLWTTDDTKAYLGKNSPDSKTIDYNLIEAGKLKRLYIGILSAPGIWHTVKEKLNSETFTKVAWKAPFDAQWLATVKLDKGLRPVNNGNFDTWSIPGKTTGARFGLGIKNKDDWTTWASLHGGFIYPFYLEKDELSARIPRTDWRATFSVDSPFVIYAYKYGKSYIFDKSPLPKNQPLLPYDKLAEVLPHHEIEHLTAVSTPENTYPATCGVTAKMLRYFKDDQEKEKKDLIVKQIDLMDKFVDVKDKRFNEYRNWAFQKIDEQKRFSEENKNLKPLADELIAYLELIEECYTKRNDKVKTAEDSAALSARYIELIDDKNLSAEQKEEEVDRLGRAIRSMGANRDNLIAEMRLTVKSIRYHLAEKLTADLSPEEEELVAKLRKDCGDILWAKHGHEGK